MPLEQDKQNGFKLSLKDLMFSGLYPNTFSRKIPLWEIGENIIFTQHGVEKLKGRSQLIDLDDREPVRGILQNLEDSGLSPIIYAGNLTNIYRVDASAATKTVVGSGYSLSEESGNAIWDSGTTTWDAGGTVWDFGIVTADHWSMVAFGDWVLATANSTPQIRKGSGNFVDMVGGSITGASIVTPGTGYTLGDILTLTGGDGSGAQALVTSVGGSGEITGIGMYQSGTGYTIVPTGLTGGTGVSAVLSHTVSDMDVSTVAIFKNMGPHILGFNTDVSTKEFIWCDADDPDTWVAASDNLAGQLEIRELQSPIRAVVPLGPRFAVYGTDQMFLVNYLANDLVFGYQAALNGIGAVSKKAVVSVGRQNYGLSQQGFFVTDGSGFQYIDEPAVRDYFNAEANVSQLSKTCAYHDEANTQIRWYFPTDSSLITGGLSYNYDTGTWSILKNNSSAGDERRVIETAVSGSEYGFLYKEGIGENDSTCVPVPEEGLVCSTTPLLSWVRSKPLDFDNADIVKELDSLRIGFDGLGLTYRLGWSETEHGTINWEAYAAMEEGFPFHNLRTAGRWLYIELYSNTLNAYWEVADIEIIGRQEGTR